MIFSTRRTSHKLSKPLDKEERRKKRWYQLACLVLCISMVSMNMVSALADEIDGTTESPTPPVESEPIVDTPADDDSGNGENESTAPSTSGDETEELLELSNVKAQIDAVLVLLEKAEELDEEGMLSLAEQAIAAKRAYERLAREAG